MLKQYILDTLRVITPEEQIILDGVPDIDRELYMQEQNNVITSHKLLHAGELITLRPHTRFIDFPAHSHNYVEILYICTGKLRQTVNGIPFTMKAGELMLLGQNAEHSIQKCGEEDIAVNFIVLPKFFPATLSLMGGEGFTLLHRFLQDCLLEKNKGPSYLYFKVSDNDKIQNLIENLIITLLYNKSSGRQKISQLIMALLFMELLMELPNATEQQKWSPQERSVLQVLSYIDNHYPDGSLEEIALSLHYDISTLSRHIHKRTGKTYTQLVQEKRMSQAAFLLRNTDYLVDNISLAVGYENISYFHHLFRKYYGISPRQYRITG